MNKIPCKSFPLGRRRREFQRLRKRRRGRGVITFRPPGRRAAVAFFLWQERL